MNDKSLKSLVEFLDWTADKGLMAKNTVGGRKAAVSAVLGILAPEETSDVTTIDLDSAMSRFVNLQGRKYNTSSLNVYKSRTNAALNDFKTWLIDPLSFKPYASKADRKAPTKIARPALETVTRARVEEGQAAAQSTPANQATANVFPIPIRENVVVRIHNLPFDLTASEAEKIANVVKAMAMGN